MKYFWLVMLFASCDRMPINEIDTIYLLHNNVDNDSIYVARYIISDPKNNSNLYYYEDIGFIYLNNGLVSLGKYETTEKGIILWKSIAKNSSSYVDSLSFGHLYFRNFNRAQNQYLFENYFEGQSKIYLMDSLYNLVEFHKLNYLNPDVQIKKYSITKLEKLKSNYQEWNKFYKLHAAYREKRFQYPIESVPIAVPDSSKIL